MGYHQPMGHGMFLGHGLMWILWAVVLAFVVYYAVRYFTREAPAVTTNSNQEALALLQTRFAKGEIGKEEYRERKLVLEM